ncbi:MAG: DUF2892 domain-containing protein [Pseudomonadota bacterium]
MFYVKNVPTWERALRVLVGLALMALAIFVIGRSPLGYALGASGIIAMLTGFFGFCPLCALAGRRLGSDS